MITNLQMSKKENTFELLFFKVSNDSEIIPPEAIETTSAGPAATAPETSNPINPTTAAEAVTAAVTVNVTAGTAVTDLNEELMRSFIPKMTTDEMNSTTAKPATTGSGEWNDSNDNDNNNDDLTTTTTTNNNNNNNNNILIWKRQLVKLFC